MAHQQRGNGGGFRNLSNGKATYYHGEQGGNQAPGDQRGAAGGQASGRQGCKSPSHITTNGKKDDAGPSYRQYGGQYGRRVGGLRGGSRDWQRDNDISTRESEPPIGPIPEKFKVIRGINRVWGFEGSLVNIAFESNVAFHQKDSILIEWFVGRATFKGHDRHDQDLCPGTRHSIRALLDQSMEGPILASVYSSQFGQLMPEYRLWSRCRIIPRQNYSEISREHRARPPGLFRSLSAITRRPRRKTTKRSMSARRRSPSAAKKRFTMEESRSPQDYARAILMPPGSFGLYDNCPKEINWQPHNHVDDMTCSHTKHVKNDLFQKRSPRPKQSEPIKGSQLSHIQKSPVRGNNGGSPKRLLPPTPTRNGKQYAQGRMNGSVSPRRRRPVLPAIESTSRSPRHRLAEPIEQKPLSASPQRGPVMQTLTVPHRRCHSVSPIRLSTSTVGTQTYNKKKKYCDCWRRARCDQCREADVLLCKILRRYNSFYCRCTRMWYKLNDTINILNDGIRKMNQENR